ncbi:hypothetical protein CEXT_780321 [Caerostris extrusa]|uniref:Uncharacterized protein n=1 Tax=Caerostris extrusa TaxID=172846 RepID=A0AAV4REM7_CAEEX|nr:hypothetical protein CEXT_780321 [Caerostris extrusa]
MVSRKRCPQELKMVHGPLARNADFSMKEVKTDGSDMLEKCVPLPKNGCALQFIKFALTDGDMHCFCPCLKIIRRKDRIDRACLSEGDMRRTFSFSGRRFCFV